MEEELKDLGLVPEKEHWFKVLGIGRNSCKIVSELSKRTVCLDQDEFFPLNIDKTDFLCIKGIRRIEKLSF